MAAAPPRSIELPEWKTREVSNVSLSASDRSLVERLRKRIAIDELRGGLRIATTSWVGVIRLAQLEIRVMPKLVGAPAWLVAMIDYAGGVARLRRFAGKHTIEQAGDNLLELFTLLLCEACQELWERGLLADYVERVEDLPVVRGRLLPDRQLRERFGRVDRLICRHDERETDILENRVLAAALDLSSRRVRSSVIRRRAHRLASLFLEQCDPRALDLEALTDEDSISYHRLNDHYRPAHQLARLVLRGLGARDLYARGSTDCFAFLLNMNSLFEAFVDRLLRELLAPLGAQIDSQHKDRTVLCDLGARTRYANVIPDLVVTGANGVCVPMDAKYKTYDDKKADRGDLYQTFLYAMAYRALAHHLPRAVLLYPTAGDQVSVRRIAVDNRSLGNVAEIRLCSLPVARLLQEQALSGPTRASLLAELLRTLDAPSTDVAPPLLTLAGS